MPTKANSIRLVGIGILSLAILGGCESSQDSASMENTKQVDPDEYTTGILTNLTPELQGIYNRPDDISVRISRRMNTDLRMFWDDWMSAMYWDRPTRLSRYPMP